MSEIFTYPFKYRRVAPWYKPWAKWKYEVTEEYCDPCGIYDHEAEIKSGFAVLAELHTDGMLWISQGYRWDGASGPTIDTANSMRASCVHDVLFQMMRECGLPQDCFHMANERFHEILLEDGMHPVRARVWFECVERFSRKHARPK